MVGDVEHPLTADQIRVLVSLRDMRVRLCATLGEAYLEQQKTLQEFNQANEQLTVAKNAVAEIDDRLVSTVREYVGTHAQSINLDELKAEET